MGDSGQLLWFPGARANPQKHRTNGAQEFRTESELQKVRPVSRPPPPGPFLSRRRAELVACGKAPVRRAADWQRGPSCHDADLHGSGVHWRRHHWEGLCPPSAPLKRCGCLPNRQSSPGGAPTAARVHKRRPCDASRNAELLEALWKLFLEIFGKFPTNFWKFLEIVRKFPTKLPKVGLARTLPQSPAPPPPALCTGPRARRRPPWAWP